MREQHHELKENIQDYATINELICLSNTENLNVENSNIGTFKLMRKNLSVFIKYLDELENKPKKERMSEAQIDSFIFDQIKKFFAPMEKERERQREAYARQCASLM